MGESHPGEGTPLRSAQPASPPAIYRPFLRVALFSTVTLGTTYGAANLLAIHGFGGAAWVHPTAHATAQLFGFVLLFIVGVALHAVPRFLGTPLRHVRWARATLPLIGGGAWIRLLAQLFPSPRWVVGGDVAILLGTCVFTAVLVATRAHARTRPEPFHLWILAGSAGWILSAALLCAGDLCVLFDPLYFRGPAWNEAAYALALYGGALLWALGMLARVGPAFVGLNRNAFDHLLPAWGAISLGAVLQTGGVLGEGLLDQPGFRWVSLGGAALLALGMAIAVWATGVFRRGPPSRSLRAPRLVLGVRLALGFLLVSGALLVFHHALSLAGRSNHLVLDGARHAFAQGFLLLLLLVIGSQMIHGFTGNPLVWVESWPLAIWLIAAGSALRLVEVAVGLGAFRLLPLSAISGVVSTLGVWICVWSLWRTLAPRRTADTPVTKGA